MAVGKKSVVTNPMETVRQHVEKKAADELSDLHSHDLVLVAAGSLIVLPAEADVALFESEQAAVRDRNAMRVTRKIGQDLLRTSDGLFGVHDPFGCAEPRKRGCKSPRLVKAGEIGKEPKFTGVECRRQIFEEQAPKQVREYVRTKASGLAPNPVFAIWRDAASRNQAVRMRVPAPTPTIP